jgi:hypothetical protein
MRYVRYVLQLLLVGAAAILSGIALFVPPQPAYAFALGVFAFFAVLFYFTLLLREHTESRLNPARRVSPRVLAGFFLLFGIGGLWLAWAMATGSAAPRSVVLRTVAEAVSPLVPSAISACFGLFMLWLAWGILKRERSQETLSK